MTATPPSHPRFNWQQFLQPAWLAGAISVGFHGVLFAVGPTFPSLGFDQLTEATAADERRNVPLVELTAAEQERLPDFSSPFYNFDDFSSLEPLAPLFENGGQSNDRGSNSGALRSPGGNNSPPSAYDLPFGITRLAPRSGSQLPLSSGLPPLGSSGSETINPDAMTPTNREAESKPPGAEALRPEAEDSDTVSQEEADAIAANSNPTDTLTLEERLQAYTFDAAQTDMAAIDTSYGQWLEQGETFALDLEIGDTATVRSAFEEAATAGILAPAADDEETDGEDTPVAGIIRRPIEMEIEYGAGICLTKEPQKGLIGAWVSPAGELLGAPEVIRSTGYLGLNRQAINYIESLDFSTVESFTGYQFEVLVSYDPEDCVEVGRTAPATPGSEAATDPERAPAEEDKTTNSEKPRSRSNTGLNEAASESEAAATDDTRDSTETAPAESATSATEE